VVDPTLQDELRITVIATGFAEKKAIPAAPPSPAKVLEMARSLARPAVTAGNGAGAGAWRRRATEARIEGFDPIDDPNDDLDVPAFLRRQAD
jgi:hypothetical protein